jgi:hypothetical protein
VKNLIISLVLACMAIAANAATVAYWQFDEAAASGTCADAVGGYGITTVSDGIVSESAVDPVGNPDAGPFTIGTPSDNPSALKSIRGGVQSGDFVFGMRDTAWTLEGFIKPQTSSSTQFIAATRGIETGWKGWELGITNIGRLDLRITRSDGADKGINTWVTGSGGAANPGTENFEIEFDVWHHFALVWDPADGSNGNCKIYVDNVIVADAAGLGSLGILDGEGLVIGGRDKLDDDIVAPTELANYGTVDEFRWSNAALTPNEFLAIPEPATMTLFVIGGMALFTSRKK